MNLHQDKILFADTITAAERKLNILAEYIEKDYWITLVLSHLSKSKYVNEAVFKGGTSLSKGYNLIERFSEDVDIAIINDQAKSGNEIKTIIRTIEKEITKDLTELQMDGITSKGSRFRKSVFEYIITKKGNTANRLIVEINSFAKPFPFQRLSIKSLIFDFLKQSGNEEFVDQYNLQPFEVNVLSKEQTLLEKLISLIRFSFDENPVVSISGKIRHFYDLYFLMNDPECAEFVASESFKKQFDTILQHDRKMFEEPNGWQNKSVNDSPLKTDFATFWKQIKGQYQSEITTLAFRPIPDEKDIAEVFMKLVKRI